MPVNADALNILKSRKYLHVKSDGNQETPEEMFIRVADHVYAAEKNMDGYDIDSMRKHRNDAFEAMYRLDFIPNTPCLVNAGFPNANLSACFVIPLEDSLESLHLAHKMQFFIQSTGGGTGFYFGNIRPNGSPAGKLDMATKGPVSWLRWFNENAGHVIQGMRKGANMGILDVTHPDVREFIKCKKEDGTIKHFNISLSVEDSFMKDVAEGMKFDLKLSHSNDRRHNNQLVNGQELFDEICHYAWMTGDPGLFFFDRVNQDNPLSKHLGPIRCTNPCGEIPMHFNDAGNLGHINLSNCVDAVSGNFNMDKFKNLVRIGVRFLDNVVEANNLPFPEIKDMNMSTRRIGLGVMDLHGALVRMGIPYDSQEALNMVDIIGEAWRDTALEASKELAEIRGPYPLWGVADEGSPKVRNAWRCMIAPTGTGSIIAGCDASGIEPRYNAATYHNHSGDQWVDVWGYLKQTLENHGITNGVLDKLKSTDRIRTIDELPDNVKRIFGVAHDIAPIDHIRMLAKWQEYADVGISKTINMPNEATEEDIKNAYLEAWKLGCKAITIYRDGSKQEQVLSVAKKVKANGKGYLPSGVTEPVSKSEKALKRKIERPLITYGSQRKIPTGYGNMMIYIGEDEYGVPVETVIKIGKSGGELSAHLEGLGRMISKLIRASFSEEIPNEEKIFKVVDSVIKQLKGIRCDQVAWYRSPYQNKSITITSVEDAVARAFMEWKLERIMKNGGDEKLLSDFDYDTSLKFCPNIDCRSSNVRFEEGCMNCPECGFSKC
jgi:ribonucleoside-diphosphate reductase alpha chain